MVRRTKLQVIITLKNLNNQVQWNVVTSNISFFMMMHINCTKGSFKLIKLQNKQNKHPELYKFNVYCMFNVFVLLWEIL